MNVLNILSMGAGVQSSTIALMAAGGAITPMPDCAIFADTQSEPENVTKWLDWLETVLPFPVHRVTAGDLGADELRVRVSQKSGNRYLKSSIPAFVVNPDGSRGLLGRKCTSDYKIVPIQRKVRELTGIKRAGRGIIAARMWIGISTDEAHRMKPSRVDYIENTFPLIDFGLSREDCLKWIRENGYPEPPRSSCRFCPFHSDDEWTRLKTQQPDDFDKVVQFEKQLQAAAASQNTLRGMPFLHGSGVPIDLVDFQKLSQQSHAQLLLWGNECEGMCGV